jgi:glycosyltransferase involved in cell wall biosynthesis
MPTASRAPLVAIVTPVYNGGAFLAEAMASVQALDYPNLVHVVLDNASTDETPDIIHSFRSAKVPVLASRNPSLVPLIQNWNRAVRMAPAEARYFHILCADDTFRSDAIAIRVDIAERDPRIGWVGCRNRAEGRLCGEGIPEDRQVFSGRELMRSYLRREHSGLSGMFGLFRSSKLDPDTDFYDPRLAVANDTDANLRVALGGKVGFVHEELVLWRAHPGQVTSQSQRNRYILFDWFELLDRYGPQVLGHREYLECRQAYRRHYLRQLLLARFKHHDRAVFDWHMKALRARDDDARAADFADALVDWVYRAAQGKRADVGSPQRQAPHAFA